MNYLEKSLERSRALVATAHEQALQLKAAGLLSGALGGSPLMGIMGDWQTQSKNRAQYAQFRGWLYAAINVLASEAASQPVYVGKMAGAEPEGSKKRPRGSKAFHMRKMTASAYSKAAATELEVLNDHPLLKSLEQPNPYQHRWQFVYSFVANLCLTGWAYIVADKEKDGRTEFYSLPTTWVIPNHSKGPFSSFKIVNPAHPETSAQDAKEFSRDQVMFAHLPNPSDPLSALAPVSTQMAAIRIDDHIQTSQERFFENGIFPGVIVTVGKDPHPDVPGGVRPRLTGQQRRQVIGAIRKVMGGIANYGNPAIVDGLIESIERLSATQNEMGWEKSEDKVRTRILSAFGVHPYILGEAVAVGGYAQVAKIEERFCKRVNTYLDMLGTVMTNFAGNMEGAEPDLMVWWEKTEPHDPGLYWQNVNAARNRDDISQNEYRALLGFAPDEDKNESVIGASAANGIIALLSQVGAGMVSKEQAKALMVGMGLPDDLAEKVAGVGEAKETLAQATGVLQEAVRSLKTSPVFLAEQIMGSLKYNPDQPRVPAGNPGGGQFGSGGGRAVSFDKFEGKPANPNGLDTEQKFRKSDGSWTKERQVLHEAIVAEHFKGKTPVDNPVSCMMGGGTAAGKSTMLKTGSVPLPKNMVEVDPDSIKTKYIPEYKQLVAAGDKGASLMVHEEASYLSKEIAKRASSGGYNIMLDGTGDNSVESLQSKIKLLRGRGQKIEAHYATCSTEDAVVRSNARGEKTGRYVPESFIRRSHASVSRVLPEAVKMGLYDKVALWDTSSGGRAIKVMSALGKEMTVHDQARWDAFLAKGGE